MEQIRWQQKAGFDVVARYLTLSGDTNGDGIADFIIKIDTSIGLVAGDFIL